MESQAYVHKQSGKEQGPPGVYIAEIQTGVPHWPDEQREDTGVQDCADHEGADCDTHIVTCYNLLAVFLQG